MNEDDTFLALRRQPLDNVMSQLDANWPFPLSNDKRIEILKDAGWTYSEFIVEVKKIYRLFIGIHMGKEFEILSVAEDNGQSDRLTGKAYLDKGYLYVSVDEKSNLTANIIPHEGKRKPVSSKIVIEEIDLDELILFLNECKAFVEESEIMNKLKGK